MAISVSEKPLSESATALPPRQILRESTAMALLSISGRHHRKRKSLRDIAMAISRNRISFSMRPWRHHIAWVLVENNIQGSLFTGWRSFEGTEIDLAYCHGDIEEPNLVLEESTGLSHHQTSPENNIQGSLFTVQRPFEEGKTAPRDVHGPTPEKRKASQGSDLGSTMKE